MNTALTPRGPDFTRRNLLRGGLALGVGLGGPTLLTACGGGDGGSGGGGGKSLTFTSDGGSYQEAMTKAWLDPFAKAEGVTVVQDSPKDYAKVKAMVDSKNVSWDVMTAGDFFGLSESDQTLLEPLTTADIPEIADINPEFVSTHRIGHEVFASVLAYQDGAFSKAPEGWVDFFDTKAFPGKRGLRQYSGGGVFEFALLGDGVDPKDLYPLDIDRALAKLDTIKNDIVWWTTGAQSAQLLKDKEVAMAHAWNGRVYTIQQEGAKVAIQWNQHFAQADNLVIPKGAKNVDLCKKLISYILSAEHNAELAKYIPYGPTNLKAKVEDEAIAKNLPTSYADVAVYFNDDERAKRSAEVDQIFQDWLRK